MEHDFTPDTEFDMFTQQMDEWPHFITNLLVVGAYRTGEAESLEPGLVRITLGFNDGRLYKVGVINQFEKAEGILIEWVMDAQLHATLYPEPVREAELGHRLHALLGEDYTAEDRRILDADWQRQIYKDTYEQGD